MINLNGATNLTTDREILDAVADRIGNSLKDELIPDDIVDSILQLLGPYRILSTATGLPEDMIRGYLREAVRQRNKGE